MQDKGKVSGLKKISMLILLGKTQMFHSPIILWGLMMKEYECVQVNHHKDVGKTIQEFQEKGWRLYSYAVAGSPTAVNHYLLFEKGAWM